MIINSLYSFWWDITYDWGLSLLQLQCRRPVISSNLPPDPRRPSSQPYDSNRISITWKRSQPGLRPTLLLFRSPLPYYCAILVNFILRLTWSIKLSPHLHRVAEREQGIFTLEILEILRRWMWVYFRVEWEVVKAVDANVPTQQENGAPEVPLEMDNLPM